VKNFLIAIVKFFLMLVIGLLIIFLDLILKDAYHNGQIQFNNGQIQFNSSSSHQLDSTDSSSIVRMVQEVRFGDSTRSLRFLANNFLNDVRWDARTISSALAYVDVYGWLEDGDGNRQDIKLTLSVIPNTDTNNMYWIEPHSLEINGTPQGGQFLADNLIIDFIGAYTHGYSNLEEYYSSSTHSIELLRRFSS